jgi:hypothetical protein
MDDEPIIRERKWISREEAKAMFPEYTPTFEEVATQMRINCDLLKKEFSDHVDSEILRFKREIDADI